MAEMAGVAASCLKEHPQSEVAAGEKGNETQEVAMKACQVLVAPASTSVKPAQTMVQPAQTTVTPYQTNGISDILTSIMPLIMIMMVMMSVGTH
jgi:hypothetical protein